MTTLKNIADLIMHDLNGGDKSKDSQVDERDIIKKARIYCNAVLQPIIWGKKAEGDNSAVTQAIYPYELSLQTDSAGQKYLTIPDVYAALVYNKGIHRLYVKGNPYRDFVIMHNPGISGRMPHTKLKNIQYCYIEGMSIKMGPGCTAKKADKLILQLINAAPDAIGVTDVLPMAPEQLSEVIRLIKADYLPTAQVPNDYVNNQNTSIR